MLLLILVFQIPLAIASEQYCFEKTTAQKLLTEIKFGQVTNDKLIICQKSYSTTKALNKVDKELIIGLKQDKLDLITVSDEYKQKYILTNEKVIQCKNNTPSRVSWFSYGIITTLIAGLVTIFAVK